MLTKSQKFKSLVLLEFTKQLIKHSGPTAVFELEHRVKEKEKEIKKDEILFTKEIKEREKELKEDKLKFVKERLQGIKNPLPPQGMISPRPMTPRFKQSQPPRVLKIPEPRLPPRLQYLRPIPRNQDIDLGKLNPLLRDPTVKAIECSGPDKNIIVKVPSTKITGITLDKEEIAEVIQKFSEASQIPTTEGLFKVVFGRLILSAIISETIGSKFIIRKMMNSPFRR